MGKGILLMEGTDGVFEQVEAFATIFCHTKEDYEWARAKLEEKPKTITQQLEDLAEDICDHFCVHRDTCDEEGDCVWIREGNACPLDRLL